MLFILFKHVDGFCAKNALTFLCCALLQGILRRGLRIEALREFILQQVSSARLHPVVSLLHTLCVAAVLAQRQHLTHKLPNCLH